MNLHEARQILLLYRPGHEANDPEMADALTLARRDPELQVWFEQHCAAQEALRQKLRQIPVPVGLEEQLLAAHKTVHLAPWRRPAWLAAAALVAGLIGLAAFWMRPAPPDRFADYRERVVGMALREYHMDVLTHDMSKVRQHLNRRGAPADYVLPPGLDRLQLTGGGALRWRSNPVAMVCFDRGDKQMLFLFVLPRAAVEDPPPATPEISKVNKLLAVSWTRQDKAYVLAGPEESQFLQKYFERKD